MSISNYCMLCCCRLSNNINIENNLAKRIVIGCVFGSVILLALVEAVALFALSLFMNMLNQADGRWMHDLRNSNATTIRWAVSNFYRNYACEQRERWLDVSPDAQRGVRRIEIRPLRQDGVEPQQVSSQSALGDVDAHDVDRDANTRKAFGLLITHQEMEYSQDVTQEQLGKAFNDFCDFIRQYESTNSDKHCRGVASKVKNNMRSSSYDDLFVVYCLWTHMKVAEASRQELVLAIEKAFMNSTWNPEPLSVLAARYEGQLEYEEDAPHTLREYLESGPAHVLYGQSRKYFPVRVGNAENFGEHKGDYEELLQANSTYSADIYESQPVTELLARLWVFISKLSQAERESAQQGIITALWDCYDPDDGHRVCNAGKMQRLAIQVLQGRLAGVAITIDEKGNQRVSVKKATQLFFSWHKQKYSSHISGIGYGELLYSMQFAQFMCDVDLFCMQNSCMRTEGFYNSFIQSILLSIQDLMDHAPSQWESPGQYVLHFFSDELHLNIVRRSVKKEMYQRAEELLSAQYSYRESYSFLQDHANFVEFQRLSRVYLHTFSEELVEMKE